MLIDLRATAVEPCFESMVKTQLTFNRESFERLDLVKKGFEYASQTGKGRDAMVGDMGGGDERMLQERVERGLMQLRELTICGTYS
jgi:hypothetical protein